MTHLGGQLAHVLVDFNRDFDLLGVGRPRPSLVQYANLLRVIPDGGISLSDLPKLARISRRAMKSRSGLPNGWLDVTKVKPRGQLWRLTDLGQAMKETGRELVEAAEEHWRAKVGANVCEELGGALQGFVAALEVEWPHYPMPYGGADTSATGGKWIAAKPGPPRIPAHGTDWIPVVRADDDSARSLPVYALASQALMQFKSDYEHLADWNMTAADRLARAFPTDQLPVHAVPSSLHIDGSGKGSLERHGIVRVTGQGDDRVAELTPRGRELVANHAGRLRAIVEGWRARYGGQLVEGLERALRTVDEKLPNDLPDYVIVRSWADASLLRRG